MRNLTRWHTLAVWHLPAVVFPDLESAELQKSLGVLGSDKVLSKLLYVGEFAALLQEVHELSGLDKDINDEVEEAKTDQAGRSRVKLCSFCSAETHIRPSEHGRMSQHERAFIYASISMRIEEEKRLAARMRQ